MKRQLEVGDRIKLLIDRGLNKLGDILTVEKIDGDIMITNEFWASGTKHSIYIKKSYKIQWEFAENEYEIY